ncbi:MAG: C40 family peptidase [Sulfuricella sp.]|nr:C40 family peptidase [Sulfuricella sp.]
MKTFFRYLPIAALFLSTGLAVAAEEPATESIPQQSFVASSIDKAHSTLNYAMSLVGINYKFGGTSPETGMDCSGFVSHVFRQAADLVLPHNAKAISMFGKKITISDLRPGDLVFYNTMRRTYSHVGIYLGDNKFVHASVTGRGVEVVDMKESYWARRFNGARRLPTLQ